jgi:hypothetical protein
MQQHHKRKRASTSGCDSWVGWPASNGDTHLGREYPREEACCHSRFYSRQPIRHGAWITRYLLSCIATLTSFSLSLSLSLSLSVLPRNSWKKLARYKVLLQLAISWENFVTTLELTTTTDCCVKKRRCSENARLHAAAMCKVGRWRPLCVFPLPLLALFDVLIL